MASVAYKELNELFDGALLAVEHVKEALADGKIDLRDLGVLLKISRSIGVYNAAIQGLNQLSLQALAEISPDELESLIAKGVQLLASIGIMTQAALEILKAMKK